ncbi:hypothetical protein [Shewanella aestuarii]|uniref:Uncharacterized protein n=1 Tax=Shewanella aestuarii TaxID=1028752 RepID=A0A6G9QR72_9GAMM|nr:hypothetical protein [Shewanella aestuarii]QIR16537.1 hypothetical protein HBH39_18850 [Shewanella aestuarii]
MNMAKHVVRYRTGDYNPKDIVKLSEQWGEFAYRNQLGICFAAERYEATQEYLIKKHKLKNGYLIIQTGDHSYEVNVVKSSFIEETNTFSTLALPFAIALKQAIGHITEDTVVLRVPADSKISMSAANVVVDKDGEEAPEKFDYQLASIAAKQNTGYANQIVIALFVAAGLFYQFGYDAVFKDEVVETQAPVVDPYKTFFAALTGGEPDVRQTLLTVKEMLDSLARIPQWRVMQINMNKSGAGLVVAAELVPRSDGDNPQRTILVSTVAAKGYSIDLQQQNPVVFMTLKNAAVYDLQNETASLVNVDQSLAYLGDAVSALIENGSITIPVEQGVVTGGDYSQKNLQVTMGGNYSQHLDYLSIIFSGWPVFFQSGRIEVTETGKYRAQFNMAILGE